jgi:hypothetical protein
MCSTTSTKSTFYGGMSCSCPTKLCCRTSLRQRPPHRLFAVICLLGQKNQVLPSGHAEVVRTSPYWAHACFLRREARPYKVFPFPSNEKPILLFPIPKLIFFCELSPIPIHAMMSLDVPPKTVQALSKVCLGFMWKGRADVSGGHCLVTWDKVTSPKRCGGLGIPNLHTPSQCGSAVLVGLASKDEPDKGVG